jgi:hypothetical protein
MSVEKFKHIFTGLERAHGVTYVDKKGADGQKIKGKSFVTREYVTDDMWSKHLQGTEPSLGIIPITDDNTCRWGCIDIDSYAGFDHKKLIDKIKNLKSQDDTGNFLNLPYFNGDDTTRYCFNDKGEAVNLESFYLLHELYKLTPDQLEKLIVKRPESEFSDGPPCLESLTQTDIKDGRDRILYQYIQYAKRKWPENWQSKINAFNYKYFERHPEGPLDDKIVQGKIKFNDGKDLGFKCNEDPMCNHCDKNLCRTRKFGIGGEAVFPSLTDLQKVLLDEPYYWVNVDGERVKLDNIDYLMEQRLFRRTVAKQINKKPPRITVKEFEKYTDMLLQGVEEVDAPVGSSRIDQLSNHLEDYCLQRSIGSVSKKDILNGAVYTENNKHVFTFHRFFHGHLTKKKWKEDYQVTQQMLKEHCGCEEGRMVIGKKKPSIMKVDTFEKHEDQFTQKKLKEEDPY